jgi:hypothetical protein
LRIHELILCGILGAWVAVLQLSAFPYRFSRLSRGISRVLISSAAAALLAGAAAALLADDRWVVLGVRMPALVAAVVAAGGTVALLQVLEERDIR